MPLGKRPAHFVIGYWFMSRLLIALVVVILVIGGGLVALAGRNSERPQTRVEKVVPLASLQQ